MSSGDDGQKAESSVRHNHSISAMKVEVERSQSRLPRYAMRRQRKAGPKITNSRSTPRGIVAIGRWKENSSHISRHDHEWHLTHFEAFSRLKAEIERILLCQESS